MSTPTLHAYMATVVYKVGEPRDVPFDVYQGTPHGFNFLREDGSATFIAADLVAEIEVKRNKHAVVMGSA